MDFNNKLDKEIKTPLINNMELCSSDLEACESNKGIRFDFAMGEKFIIILLTQLTH